MKRIVLAFLVLSACKVAFPQDRAEACLLQTAQEATRSLTSVGGLLQGLIDDPKVKTFDIGSVRFADVKFGTCRDTGPDQFECAVEYQMDFSGDGGKALVELAGVLGKDIEARRVETWNFQFGPSVTQCNPV